MVKCWYARLGMFSGKCSKNMQFYSSLADLQGTAKTTCNFYFPINTRTSYEHHMNLHDFWEVWLSSYPGGKLRKAILQGIH